MSSEDQGKPTIGLDKAREIVLMEGSKTTLYDDIVSMLGERNLSPSDYDPVQVVINAYELSVRQHKEFFNEELTVEDFVDGPPNSFISNYLTILSSGRGSYRVID
jgi:hypothetical protein